MGKPVVASDTSGLKEVVVDGETGNLFPIDDVSTLVHTLQKLLCNSGLRHNLGAAGLNKVKENFSLGIFERKIKALYSHYFPSGSF